MSCNLTPYLHMELFLCVNFSPRRLVTQSLKQDTARLVHKIVEEFLHVKELWLPAYSLLK